MGFWGKNKDKLVDVYQTATSHLEAARIMRERYGIKCSSEALRHTATQYKIARPNIKHRGEL